MMTAGNDDHNGMTIHGMTIHGMTTMEGEH